MQLISDAMNIPVIAGPVEATATGNILSQAIASGILSGLDEAREMVRNSFELITYSPDAVSVANFRKLAPAFSKIAQ